MVARKFNFFLNLRTKKDVCKSVCGTDSKSKRQLVFFFIELANYLNIVKIGKFAGYLNYA